MYQKILTALDGSACSNLSIEASLALAEKTPGVQLVGIHVYAAQLHRSRFEQMEPGLPEAYQTEARLSYLRQTHEDLITDGMQLISDSYLAPLAQAAQKRSISCSGAAPEGRNYVELLNFVSLQKPDLLVMGAHGHGWVPEARLGSLAERALLGGSNTDILLMRRLWNFKNQPILVGIDGSPDSYHALERAIQIARLAGAAVETVAVYDPFFHSGVFNVIASALPPEAQHRFNFPAQERLHDEIIDSGLEKLYREGLERAALFARQLDFRIEGQVLSGKVYPQIHHFAHLRHAGLVVLGRYGLHREPASPIGSNTLNLARLLDQNLLVVAPPVSEPDVPQFPQKVEQTRLNWTKEAEEILNRIPVFARGMARRSIEDKARSASLTTITTEFVKSNSPMGKK